MDRAGQFGSPEAASAARALEIAWATLRHDAALYQAGAITDRAHLCRSTCGHLGCAVPQCAMLCTEEQVASAIAHIGSLADGAWLVYDLARARHDAVTAVAGAAQSVGAAEATCHAADTAWGDRFDAVRSAAYRACRPYVDAIHHLHGRLWGVYAPFWALASRTAVEPSPYDPRRLEPSISSPLWRPPTPRDLETILAPPARSPPAMTAPQMGACEPCDVTVCEGQWMEVDQGACMPGVARLRAVALARRMAHGVAYPPPDDTGWAAGRHALLGALGASPDTRVLLTVKDHRRVLADGSRVASRKVSLRADFAVCPFATTNETRGAGRARSRRQSDFDHYFIVARACNHTVAVGDAHGQAEAATDAGDGPQTGGAANESTNRVRRDGMSPTVACMQRLCVGKYTLDGWLSRIARCSRDALHTIALLNGAPSTTHTRSARRGDLGFRATSPYATGGVTVVQRQVVLDGCLVAILARDAYVVQPAVRAAEPRLFVATHRLSVTPPPPDRSLDRRAAVDAMRLLNGNPRANMPARRTLAALRYATWYACAAGHPDGYDAALVASLLDRVGFHPTRGLVARLVLLWSP